MRAAAVSIIVIVFISVFLQYNSTVDRLRILFSGFYTEGTEFPSASFIETAEDFVIFQTKDLDAHDQTFHSADEKVAQNDHQPVR